VPTRKKASAARKGRAKGASDADDRLQTETSDGESAGPIVAKTVVRPGFHGADVPVVRAAAARRSFAAGRLDQEAAASIAPATSSEGPIPTAVARSAAAPDLPDIATFSDAMPFASARSGIRPEIVIGADDRRRVNDTTAYPWRAIASLVITTRNGRVGVGTAWFISPRTLVTAGHCVFIQSRDPALHGWVRRIVVMPGRDGPTTPFGAITALQFQSVRGWTRDASEGYDYGAIILSSSADVGNRVGTFGVGALSNADSEDLVVNVSGYPDDKKGVESGTQWYHAQSVIGVSRRQVEYVVDTWGGQSGSPVFCLRDEQFVAVAVHAYGGSSSNSGTRITPDVLEVLDSWKQ
jgi:glutamyl endopeptidase